MLLRAPSYIQLSPSRSRRRRDGYPLTRNPTTTITMSVMSCKNQIGIRARQNQTARCLPRPRIADDDDSAVSVELEPIITEQHFNRIMDDSQHQLLILWMATWCRKCIYLKPKLEKLAADYHPRIRFYCIDVNAVPHKLVARAGVTKMPTIQVWKGSKKQAEVIGGHKAYLVINDIREMIEDGGSP